MHRSDLQSSATDAYSRSADTGLADFSQNQLTLTIPANAMADGSVHTVRLQLDNVINVDTTSAPGFLVGGIYAARTEFTLRAAAGEAGSAAVQFFVLNKRQDFSQTSAYTPLTAVLLADPNGIFFHEITIGGTKMAALAPTPTITRLTGSQLTLDYRGNEWKTPTPWHDYSTKADLDAAWPNGTYALQVGGTSFPLRLGTGTSGTADAYPTAVPQVTAGGTWRERTLIVPSTGATLTLAAFPEYAAGGIISANFYDLDFVGANRTAFRELELNSVTSISNAGDPTLASVTLNGSTLPGFAAGKGYYVELVFVRFTDYRAQPLPGATFGGAGYQYLTALSVRVAAAGATASTIASAAAVQSNSNGSATLSVGITGSPAPSVQWKRNGNAIAGATNATLVLSSVSPADTGIYSAVASNSAGDATSHIAVGVSTTQPVIGAGSVVGSDIVHPNGNHFDQVLVTGAAEAVTAASAANRVTRTSFIDLNDDIVQVEFSGHGTLSLVLAGASGPAAPVNYTQPAASYMKGHAGIVIMGADETSNLSVFTVGRATAFDPTGHYKIELPPSGTNVPATNGSALFVGHETTAYDGRADIAFIAITSTNGKFGGVRASNARFWATEGLTGVYAPGVAFQGPLFVGDIDARGTALPVLLVGSTGDARITGGDLFQTNGAPLAVSGLTQLKFTAGSDSSGNLIGPFTNAGLLLQDGVNVTASIVVNP